MQKIRTQILSLSLCLFGIALIVAAMTDHALIQSLFANKSILATVLGSVITAFSVLVLITSFDRGRTIALLRLDWFVPAIRRLKPDQSASYSLPGRLLRRILPKQLQSDHAKKRRGPFRKWIRKIGISWLASPARRIVQAVCLLLFFALFLYVCWPYSAQIQQSSPRSNGWKFETVDQDSGEFIFRQDSESIQRLSASDPDKTIDSSIVQEGKSLFVVSQMNDQSEDTVGLFQVASAEEGLVHLNAEEITSEILDTFLESTKPFALTELDPNRWPDHYARNLERKEIIPAESFLIIDPLVSLSTAIASRSWVGSLISAAAILMICVLIPRGFCGYLCPLGTTIDLFDWAIGKRTKKFRLSGEGWWVHIKYYLLAGTLIAAVCGVLVSGFFSAIPVITRGMLFIVDPLQNGISRGWHLVPPFGLGQFLSIGLFLAVLMLGFLRPRFWCKYVCPSGAVFSLGNLFRLTERKVESSCINCNKCIEICPFDAIKPDFTTRTTDCTMCQSCGGVCPTHSIKFVERWNLVELKTENDPPTHETKIGRRGFLSLAAGSTAAAVGGITIAQTTKTFGSHLEDPDAFLPVRPPGSVPEQEFLEMCIRCGECFKACPNNVLQVEGFQQGLEGLWSPMVNADWAGCESSCNACGQVCPTGAIRALPLEEKKVARMGLAIVDMQTCLPFAGSQECDLCVQECSAAGYKAIEFTQVGTEVDAMGQPIEGTGFLAPVVLEDKCVGCGLCQTRCHAINVKSEKLLNESAIIIKAGQGREDRLMTGSYIELRQQEAQKAEAAQRQDDNPITSDNSNNGDSSNTHNRPLDPGSDPDPFGQAPTQQGPDQQNDSDPFGTSDSDRSDGSKSSKSASDLDPFGVGDCR